MFRLRITLPLAPLLVGLDCAHGDRDAGCCPAPAPVDGPRMALHARRPRRRRAAEFDDHGGAGWTCRTTGASRERRARMLPAVAAWATSPTGTGWYRKAFRSPAGARGQEVWLEFDGVYMNSDVWINGVHLGRRPYGYISFAYDVTRHLVPASTWSPCGWTTRGSPTPGGTPAAGSIATSG